MSFPATVIEVLIASPSDVIDERKSALEIVHEWNRRFAKRHRFILQPRMWELDAIPSAGSSAQDSINEQFADDCDLLVAVFWHRLGTSTTSYPSGTVEEITRYTESGKPAIIYFSSRQVGPYESRLGPIFKAKRVPRRNRE